MMRRVMGKILALALFILVALFWAQVCLGQENDIREEFEKRYQAWKKWLTENPWVSYPTWNSPPYEALKELGLPILPLVLEKLKSDPDAWFIVGTLFYELARFAPPGEWGNIPFIIRWWERGRKETAWRFKRWYEGYKVVKDWMDEERRKRYLRTITDLGIPALPFLIKKIEEGESDLMVSVSRLTSGAVKEDATPEECIRWWEENKEKWTLPDVEVIEEHRRADVPHMGAPMWASAKEDVFRKEFEKRFQDYMKAFDRPEVKILSQMRYLPPEEWGVVDEVGAMVGLGFRTIPFLIEKLKEGGKVAEASHRMLMIVTKKQDILVKSESEYYERWKGWWEGGEEGVRKEFKEKLEKLEKGWERGALGNHQVPFWEGYRDLKNMGIPVLPMIIEELRKGNCLLIGVALELMDRNEGDRDRAYDFQEDASIIMRVHGIRAKDVLFGKYEGVAKGISEWWDENKKMYLIPWPKKEGPKVQKPKKPGVRKQIRKRG